MIQVSEKFKQAVYAPTRRATAKVKFEIINNDAYEDSGSAVSSTAPISRTDQITNKVRSMRHKYATFEPNYFQLDGSYRIPPRPTEGDNELGWWSGNLSDANGVFFVPEVIEIGFGEPQSSLGLTIYFDVLANEYAVDFDIHVYDSVGSLIAHDAIANNIQTSFPYVQALDNIRRIVITIKKWCSPFRRARIVEVDFGVVQEYSGDKLIKVNLIEEMNVVGDTIPANELKFTIDNSSRDFNVLNPSGFYRFLEAQQEVSLSIGIEIEDDVFEFIDFKNYFLTDWQSDEGALTTTFTARNIFELLEQTEYTNSVTGTLYDLSKDIFIKAGVVNYFIDESLKLIPTTGFADKITSRKALQCIGIASMCAVYQDRQGISSIRRFDELNEGTTFSMYAGPDMFSGMVTPTISNDYQMKNITFDNVYKEPQIKLDKLVKTVVMTVYSGGEKVEHSINNSLVREGAVLKCDNPLIQSFEQATEIGQWIIDESNLRALYTVNWRQNPALECGDVVLIEDSFNAKKQSRITKQEFEFTGYLSGKTVAKGGV